MHGKDVRSQKGETKCKKVAIMAVGNMVRTAAEVRDRIKEETNYEPELINVRFINPIDKERIRETIKDFEVIYRRQKWHPHVFKKTIDPIAGVTYSPTVFTGLFVREDINADKLRYINDILGDGFGISPISSECYHELIMNRNDTLWECYDRTLFTPLKGTDYFYRKGGEHRIKEINTVLHDKINESKLCPSDENLLDKFYANNRILILSIYRILLENEQDSETYELRKKDYFSLLKNY